MGLSFVSQLGALHGPSRLKMVETMGLFWYSDLCELVAVYGDRETHALPIGLPHFLDGQIKTVRCKISGRPARWVPTYLSRLRTQANMSSERCSGHDVR